MPKLRFTIGDLLAVWPQELSSSEELVRRAICDHLLEKDPMTKAMSESFLERRPPEDACDAELGGRSRHGLGDDRFLEIEDIVGIAEAHEWEMPRFLAKASASKQEQADPNQKIGRPAKSMMAAKKMFRAMAQSGELDEFKSKKQMGDYIAKKVGMSSKYVRDNLTAEWEEHCQKRSEKSE